MSDIITPDQLYAASPATLPLTGSETIHLQQGGTSKGFKLFRGVQTMTGSTTIGDNVATVFLNAASGTITVPSGLPVGTRLHIEKISASAGTMTIARSGSETFQGATSLTITQQYGRACLTKVTSTVWVYEICESGTFTPDILFGGASTGITYATRSCAFKRVNNIVNVAMTLRLSSKGSATGTATISGMPYANGLYQTGLNVSYREALNVGTNLYLTFPALGSTVNILEINDAGSPSLTTNSDFSDTTYLIINGTYQL